MRFLDLSVNNIGVFRGWHNFTLSPFKQAHLNRHITVITGHNGAGKTTLFRMIPLALHGLLSIGERVRRQAYNDFLHDLLHRQNTNSGSSISRHADIAVTIAYVQSGKTTEITVKRSFKRNGSSITENLTVTQDGEEVKTNDPQGWLNDLIPLGLAPVCFFDAEELAALVGGSSQNDTLLGDTVRRLLGLYLVERLQTDLKHYILKQGGGRDTDNLRAALLQQQSLLESRDSQLTALNKGHAELTTEHRELQAVLAQQERRLLAEGGSYAKQCPKWQAQLAETNGEIGRLEEVLRHHSSELLPFTLAPELVMQLRKRLDHEMQLRREQLAVEMWAGKSKDILTAVESSSFWEEVGFVPKDLPERVAGRLQDLLEKLTPEKTTHALVHDLSSSESAQLKEWTAQVLYGLDDIPVG